MKWTSTEVEQLAGLLERETQVQVTPHVALAPLTSWKVGGNADILARPDNVEEAERLLIFLQTRRWPWVVLGRGTNVLAPDAGIRGVVVHFNHLDTIEPGGDARYRAEAGAALAELVRLSSSRGDGGIEDLAAIPGSVGGAVVMNAGAGEQSLGDTVSAVKVVQGGEIRRLSGLELNFGYRCSGIGPDMVVLEVMLQLQRLDARQSIERRTAALAYRKQAQKVDMPNAGSVFRNPPATAAWKLIDACGLRGFCIGGAQVSVRHANFIVNTGSASAADIADLIAHVQSEVMNKCGVKLKPEIRFLHREINVYET